MTLEEQMQWSANANGLKFAIVVARFHSNITDKLLAGAQDAFQKAGAAGVSVFHVPGTYELPLAAQKVVGSYDGVVALGAVVRGETPHFEFVADAASHGLMRVGLDSGKPVAFGILTTDSYQQAIERAGGAHGNKGFDAAMTAIEMARFGQVS